MQPRERLVEANGLVHHVLEWGEPSARETMVLCHGFLDMAWGFAALAPLLAERGLRVLAADFRGHGETGRVPPGGYYYFPDYVLDLHVLLPQLVTSPFHLVGHSMGGTVSTLFAATHPGQLRTLAVLEGLGARAEPASRSPARTKRWLDAVASARAPKSEVQLDSRAEAEARLAARHPTVPRTLIALLAEKSTRPHTSGTGLTWRFDPLHRTQSPIAFDAERYLAHLACIDAKTLAVTAERGLRGEDEATRLGALRDARHVLLPQAGHMMHWTHPAEVAQLLADHALL